LAGEGWLTRWISKKTHHRSVEWDSVKAFQKKNIAIDPYLGE
jgi:hypothetical protein